jgi:hypothetical protein
MTAFEPSMWLDEKPSNKFHDPSSTAHFATEATLATPPTKNDAGQGKDALAKGVTRSRAVFVDRSVLDSMAHLPRDKAAQMLGLCSTTFKKVCRRAGLQGWPYKQRHLPPSWSPVVVTLAASSPGRSPFSASHATTSQPIMMPLRDIHVGSVFSSSDSSMASNNTDFSVLDATAFQRIASFGLTPGMAAVAQQTRWVATPRPSAEKSCHVVDAVMDYLDTLSSGCTSAGMAAVHHLELEAVVGGIDVEG